MIQAVGCSWISIESITAAGGLKTLPSGACARRPAGKWICPEIGRASCRERVEISEGDVSLKEKDREGKRCEDGNGAAAGQIRENRNERNYGRERKQNTYV